MRLSRDDLWDRVTTLDEILASLLLILIVTVITLQIFARWLGSGMAWPGELSRALNIWIVYLLLGRIALYDRHIAVGYFVDKMAKPDVIVVGTYIINLLVAVVIAIASLQMMSTFREGTTPALGIPIPLLFLAGVVGMTIFGAVQGYKLYTHFAH